MSIFNLFVKSLDAVARVEILNEGEVIFYVRKEKVPSLAILDQLLLDQVVMRHGPHCNGDIRMVKITNNKNALVCLNCNFRWCVPSGVDTIGKLREYSIGC